MRINVSNSAVDLMSEHISNSAKRLKTTEVELIELNALMSIAFKHEHKRFVDGLFWQFEQTYHQIIHLPESTHSQVIDSWP